MKSFLLLLLCVVPAMAAHSIMEFGGVPNDPSNEAAWANSRAFTKAISAANYTQDRVALIPAGQRFYIFDVQVAYMWGVTIQIDGELYASNNITEWPKPASVHHDLAVLYIQDSSNITITGQGVFDGQGYDWWWKVLLGQPDQRPHLVVTTRVTNLLIKDTVFQNSPQFHVKMNDVLNVLVDGLTVWVDVEQQKTLLKRTGFWDDKNGIPTFPLNTDGVDPSGRNVEIRNCNITNFDDAVAVKPANKGHKYSVCAQDMYVHDNYIKYSVGLTIGSVPPSLQHNCVKNILFENNVMEFPLKAVYIKTNPGDHGTGEITDITYRNLEIRDALWYPIWIGPQQQDQPGNGSDTGCSFLYPIVPTCPTQPRVPVSGVTLENVHATGTLLLPGVVLCPPSRPCERMVFTNVTNSGPMLVQKDYVCKNAKGSHSNTSPDPGCF